MLAPGRYPPETAGQVLLEDRRGSVERPIIIRPAGEPHSAELPQLSVRRSSAVYVLDVSLAAAGNADVIPSEDIVIHFASCEDVLVRGVKARGLNGPGGMPAA